MLPPGSRRSKIRPPRNSLLSSFVGGSASSSSGSSSSANAGAEDYEKSWAILSSAIIQIQNKNVSNLSYEQLYRKAYILVLRKQGSRLYENVTQLIVKHLLERREALLARLSKESGGEFLKTLLSEWTEHLQSMKFISDVLMYLNRVYVKERKKLLIYDLGIQLYKENLIKYNNNEVGEKLIDIIIEEVTKSRLGEVITTKMYIVKVINMMELLEETSPSSSSMISEVDFGGGEGENYYQRFFEPRFLASSETFFYQLSHQFMSENISGSAYLHEISQFIKDEEENRARYYLPMSTFPKLIDLMNNILIKDKIDEVILLPMDRQGLSFWMEGVIRGVFENQNNPAPATTNSTRTSETSANVKELAILYELVGRIDPERELLKVRLKELVINQGQSLPTLVRKKLENNSDEQGSSMGNNSKKTSTFSYSSTSFAIEWINTILEYQEQLSTISRIAFNNDPGVVQAITVAIRDFINNSSSANNKKIGKNSPLTASASELLSIFMDNYIKQFTKQSPSKSSSINEEFSIDQLINRSITFLRFIKDKDTFEAHYANHFAKRFLNTKAQSSLTTTTTSTAASKTNNKSERHSTSIDLEELILSKLMEEMGSSSLEKVMKMNRDIKLSRDLTNDWKRHIKSNGAQYSSSHLVELELKICNVTDWPKSMTKDYKKYSEDNAGGINGFPWPKQLRGTLSEFEDYWLTGKKNDNKSLHWSPKFGSMDLRITYPSPMKTYEINLSTYAGIIMLLFAPQSTDNITGEQVLAFSEMRELKYEEIRELTKIPEQDLKRQLQSIAVAPRLRLLVKVPMTKEVNEGDIFKLNEKFKSPTIKVKVLTVSATSSSSKKPTAANASGEGLSLRKTEAQEEAEEVAANIVEGRNVEINAAIVRIMKSRQTLNHNDLISELIRQLQNRFLPLTIQIKQRIEDLIQREYLKRDLVEKSKYHYVA